jgi:hypothetical protein
MVVKSPIVLESKKKLLILLGVTLLTSCLTPLAMTQTTLQCSTLLDGVSTDADALKIAKDQLIQNKENGIIINEE